MNPPRSEGFVRMPDAEFEAILTRAAEEAARLAGADGAERYPSKKLPIGSSGGQPALWSFSDWSTIQREIALLAMASRSPRLRLAMGACSLPRASSHLPISSAASRVACACH